MRNQATQVETSDVAAKERCIDLRASAKVLNLEIRQRLI